MAARMAKSTIRLTMPKSARTPQTVAETGCLSGEGSSAQPAAAQIIVARTVVAASSAAVRQGEPRWQPDRLTSDSFRIAHLMATPRYYHICPRPVSQVCWHRAVRLWYTFLGRVADRGSSFGPEDAEAVVCRHESAAQGVLSSGPRHRGGWRRRGLGGAQPGRLAHDRSACRHASRHGTRRRAAKTPAEVRHPPTSDDAVASRRSFLRAELA